MQTSASLRPPPVLVEDHREHRIRKPADLLRGLACIVGVVVLGGLGIVASATADGVETNIVEVSKAVPHAVLVTVRPIAPPASTVIASDKIVVVEADRIASA